MSYGTIYKIQFPNGKNYIGLTTTSLEQRKREHKCCAKNENNTNLLYNALRKYDMVDTFELIEIDTADTLEELCEKEIRYIQEYNSYYLDGNGYNMTYGGDGVIGYVYTEEDKLKMSEAQKKRFENPEAIQQMSEIKKIYYENNPDAGKEHSEKMKKHFENPEAIKKNSEAQKKRYENPEAIQKCSEAQKKRFENNPEARQQMSEIKKKYFENNPEARQKCSETLKKRFENPEVRQQQSEARKKYYEHNPEAKQKHGDAIQNYYKNNPDKLKERIEAHKKSFENPDVIEKCSQSQKKRFENQNERQKCSEAQKKRFENNPEARQQMSEIKKKYFENNPEARQKILGKKGQNKPFDIFTVDGTFIKTFNYQFEAKEYLQKEYNITSTMKIGAVLEGKRCKTAGFVFKYK